MKKRTPKNHDEEIEFTTGSGNVYADFGFPNSEEAKTKAELAMLITNILKEKNVTQHQAADIMGIDQPKVSKITRGLVSEFSIERLMKFVISLGFDIEIIPKPHHLKTSHPSIHVVFEKNLGSRLTV
jgi:predicted XRE-type DNA-binding protein